MKVILAGASGHLGQKIVPLLANSGVDLILVGREKHKLQSTFPKHYVCDYDDARGSLDNSDLFVNLAVMNNDASCSEKEFIDVNINFAHHLVKMAKDAGVKIFVNVSSIHALNHKDQSPYAKSKRSAYQSLSHEDGIEIITLFLPFVYDGWDRQLRFLNYLPKPYSRGIFELLKSLKPSLCIDTLKDVLIACAAGQTERVMILSDKQSQNKTFRFLKYCMDLAISLSIAAFLWWLFLLIWASIRLSSSGPAILKQERVGRDSKTFILYKFRTMVPGTPNIGTHEVDQKAVTSVGNFLRMFKLDELPQIWNILRGEMSFVGPRPCLPSQTQLIKEREKLGVLSVAPGITGLAQINRIDMSDPKRLARMDAQYLALQSLLLDIQIILATFLGKGRGDKINSLDV